MRKKQKVKGNHLVAVENTMATMEIRVAFGDTDPYGVVFYASYFKYFHRGIEDFFISRGFSPAEVFKNNRLDFGLPVVHAACRYNSPARYGDVLSLETILKSVRDKVLIFTFTVRPKGGERLIAEGEVTMVGINSRWKASSLPKAFIARLREQGMVCDPEARPAARSKAALGR